MLTTKAKVDQQTVEIEELLRNVSTILKKRSRDILSDFDITPPQLDALLVLREFGELTMGELCQKMFLACSTATDLIDRMERNQFIERVRDTNDRRVIRLRILNKGYQVLDDVLEARQNYLSGILANVEGEERERLIHSLEQIHFLMTRGLEA